MINTWEKRIEYELIRRKQKKIYRKRKVVCYGNDKWLVFNGRKYLNFSSNNYLGLARHPKLIESYVKCAEEFGIGSGGSGHIIGYTPIHKRLEDRLARWLGYEKAILFSSGFSANQAIINTLIDSEDQIFLDKMVHASIIEASMRSKGRFFRYLHNDPCNLEKLLKRRYTGNRLIFTEGVFSMDGTRSPISKISEISKKNSGLFLVDDAHGIGVIGREGKGISDELRKEDRPDLLVITFGKAFGVSGAAILCNYSLSEYFVQFSKNLIYSTSLSLPQVAAINTALDLIKKGKELRNRIEKNIFSFCKEIKKTGFFFISSDTAIQSLIIGESKLAILMERFFQKKGIWLKAILPPTVPPKTSRFRITLTSFHQDQDISKLLEIIEDAQKYFLQRKS